MHHVSYSTRIDTQPRRTHDVGATRHNPHADTVLRADSKPRRRRTTQTHTTASQQRGAYNTQHRDPHRTHLRRQRQRRLRVRHRDVRHSAASAHWVPSLTTHTTPDTTQAPANRSCEHNVQLRTQRCDGTHAAEPGAQRGGRHTTHTAVATPTRSGTAQGHRSGRRRLQPHQWCITSTKQCSGTGPQRRTFHRSAAGVFLLQRACSCQDYLAIRAQEYHCRRHSSHEQAASVTLLRRSFASWYVRR